MEKKKNILFFMTDHQRYDTMGMVQCGREVTPNLNKLAQEGMVFERAYDTCPLCVPARTALATGVYPTNNGVVYNCLLYTSPSPRDRTRSRMPSSA